MAAKETIKMMVLIVCLFLSAGLALAQSPGDTVGWTRYDYQTNGSTGTRCALDNTNGAHVIWLKGFPGNQRGIYYNYIDSAGYVLYGSSGTQLCGNLCGMPQMAIGGSDMIGIVYNSTVFDTTYWISYPPFEWYTPPTLYWPYNAITSSGYYQLVGVADWTSHDEMIIGYTMSTNSGGSWSPISVVDTTMTIATIITASRVSDRTAIVYTHPIYGDSSAWLNNVYYIESSDGVAWDWSNKINISHYEFDEDSMYAFTDLDAVYDNNDNLHVIWNAVRLTPTSFDPRAYLFHCEGLAETPTEITHHPDTASWPEGCEWGAWNLAISKPSIAVDASNRLFVCYTRFNPDDCSAGGYANGEIYAQYSDNSGLDWSSPLNLTNSPSDSCLPGDCNSDHWSSMAEEVNDYLHILYVNDKDAGGMPQTEGQATDNPMLYLRYPVSALGADENLHIQISFTLHQNYPNPFNAKTRIDFELKDDADVRLDIFNITGARVATLIDGELNVGPHSIIWDAGKVASGIYYYALKAGDEEQTKRMVLIK